MALSIVFFLIYILIAAVIGVVSARRESEEAFMIGERSVHGAQLAATLSAGFFDGATLAIYFAYVYQYGFSAIWLFIGLFIGFHVLRFYAPRIKQRVDELRVYTMSEYFYRLLGKRNGLLFSVFLVLQFFLILIVNLIVSGKVLVAIFHLPYWIAVAIGGLVVMSYLVLGGFKAVMKTDFFQLIIMFIMTFVTAGFLLGHNHIARADLNLTAIGPSNIIGFIILIGLGIMVAPDVWQRIMASRGVKELKRGLSFGSIILIILGLSVSVFGLVTKEHFPGIRPEDALVTGFAHLLPTALTALAMVLLYAVSLSSTDTTTFVISSIVTRDLKNYTKKYSESSMRVLTRVGMIGLIVLAVVVGISYDKIVNIGFSLASLNLALFPVVFGSLYWKLKEPAVFWSLILALLSVVVLFVSQQLSPTTAVISLPVALVGLLVLSVVLKPKHVKD